MGVDDQKRGSMHYQSREELIEEWVRAHNGPPPKGISRRLLEYSAAYHQQARTFGGLTPTTRRKLRQFVDLPMNAKGQAPSTNGCKRLPPGSRLIREWRGRSHTVEVMEAGYLYDGERYRSLSAVARAITGARWSGPRFFGI